MRTKTRLNLVGGMTAVMMIATAAQARDLTVVSWGGSTQDGQHTSYIEPFAKDRGITVLEESWDGGIGVIQSKVAAGNPAWDVVEVEAEELALGCADGLFEKIDWARIGNKEDFLTGAASDCGVGTFVWSTVLAYDGSVMKDGPKSWVDFWNVQKFPGKRALRRGPKYNLELALMADGVSPEHVYQILSTPGGVDRAFEKLDELKQNIVWWESGAQPLQLLASGEVAMTSAYNGRITALNKSESRDLRIVWNGSIPAVDSWVILKGSPNVDLAQDFLAYASRPEKLAALSSYVAYGPPTRAGTALVDKDIQINLPTAPENLAGALPLNVEFWIDNLEELSKRYNAWVGQ